MIVYIVNTYLFNFWIYKFYTCIIKVESTFITLKFLYYLTCLRIEKIYYWFDFKHLDMKNFNTKKIIRALAVIACLFFTLFLGLLISINFIIDPIIYWLASTEGARIFIGCILSWLGVSKIFDLFYKNFKRRKKIQRFNALSVPYPRTFKGRKWY